MTDQKRRKFEKNCAFFVVANLKDGSEPLTLLPNTSGSKKSKDDTSILKKSATTQTVEMVPLSTKSKKKRKPTIPTSPRTPSGVTFFILVFLNP